MSALLELRRVSRHFGTLRALNDVSTAVDAGEIRGLIGPNGAGKTTLVNVLTGFLPPTAGHVLLEGRRIDRLPAHARVRGGLGRTFQTPQLCRSMSVLDNIVVGAHQRMGCARFRSFLPGGGRARLGLLREEAAEIAAQVGLDELLGTPAGGLAYGSMRRLEIARALAAKPRVLLLDEPVAGMNESESDDVAEIVRRVRDAGTTVLLIEHDMTFVMGLCDRITVLDHGVLLAEGTPEEVQRNERVEDVYLGTRSTS